MVIRRKRGWECAMLRVAALHNQYKISIHPYKKHLKEASQSDYLLL